jgi:hypothetical protein
MSTIAPVESAAMTTERRGDPKPKPRLDLSALEWRLLLTAALAATYVLAWFEFRTSLPASAVRGMVERRSQGDLTAPGSAVWLTDLPPGERPAVELPPGWTLASPVAPEPAPVVVRVPSTHAPRMRTRSS